MKKIRFNTGSPDVHTLDVTGFENGIYFQNTDTVPEGTGVVGFIGVKSSSGTDDNFYPIFEVWRSEDTTDGTNGQTSSLLPGSNANATLTSFNALLELQSTTGTLLLTRQTKSQIEAMQHPVGGMLTYCTIDDTVMPNKTINELFCYQPDTDTWIPISGVTGDVIGPGPFTQDGEIPMWTDGTGINLGISPFSYSNVSA